ncbi:esterase family protein [Occultella aeris]|uniref:Endo-1,4-beta-xylanase Z n=1 Tax=Occultella aeris TaxID=2761496 RepID=A0A7M4DGH3_9MICO|nr:alpha/beta hydrolase-fold protein [Occultella aeris]VZO36016.1 Endo-1,4-beta-xylanase Z precursor [Occultella aeris]
MDRAHDPPTTVDVDVHVPAAVIRRFHEVVWLSSWRVVLPVGIACTTAAGALVLRVARAIRRGSRSPTASSAVLVPLGAAAGLLMATGALVANALAGYVPTAAAGLRLGTHGFRRPRHESTELQPRHPMSRTGRRTALLHGPPSRGTVYTVTVPGDLDLEVPPSTAWVYLPPGVETASPVRYPAIYLIHGTPGTSADWFAAALVDRAMDVLLHAHLVRPMILVSIDANGGPSKDTECLNWRDGPQIETWLYRTVIPFVDRTLPTIADRTARGLGGMSMGGFCALDQGLRHLDSWGLSLVFEGYGDPGSAGPAALGDDPDVIAAHTPSSYLPHLPLPYRLPVYLDVGERTADVGAVRDLARQLADRGQTVYFRIARGHGHSWAEVRDGLPYALTFASAHLRGTPPVPGAPPGS